MVKIYTRTGDDGNTHLFGGERVPKSSPRVKAYGAVDEVNSQLGIVRSGCDDEELTDMIVQIQRLLFVCGADLATPGENQEEESTTEEDSQESPEGPHEQRVRPRDTEQLETWIDTLSEELEPLRNFILPGGSPTAARLHLCRSLCRRAERAIVELAEQNQDPGETLPFINRLSDLLFTMARVANHRAGMEEHPWQTTRE